MFRPLNARLAHRTTPRRTCAGLSLVDLLVGTAVGLGVVAAATLVTGAQLADNRRLVAETQLQQDLRATLDIVTRELRRSSHWAAAPSGVPTPAGSAIGPNPLAALAVGAGGQSVQYRYRRATGAEAFGLRLNNGAVQACQSDLGSDGQCSGTWQELTDPNTVTVTTFTVTPARSDAGPDNAAPLTLPCPHLCADGSTACWPALRVRELVVTLSGRAKADSSVRRTLSAGVRVRNDRVDLSAEAAAGQACPAG